jgi:hypothetical protein
MSETVDRITEMYGSSRVKARLDGWQQRRALEEEGEWFAQTHDLLVELQQADGASYPMLSEAIELLERKQVELGLVEAWTLWHGGQGEPVEAAKSLSAFLCTSGSQALYDPDDPDDRLVRYTQALLRALLDAQVAVPLFDDQRPLPLYLAGTLLARYLYDYERVRAARGPSNVEADGP